MSSSVAEVEESTDQACLVSRESKPINHKFGNADEPWVDYILSKAFGDEREASSQSSEPGAKELPFDMYRARRLVVLNPHHSACMRAKTASLVGMGFVVDGDTDPEMEPSKKRKLRSKASKALDPLCLVTFQDVLNDVGEEFWHVGNGYMEIVRGEKDYEGAIKGVYHAPAPTIRLVVEPNGHDFHYEEAGGGGKKFARFGDLKRFMEDIGNDLNQEKVGEIIHFRQSSSLSRWYGFPDWLAAISAMELAGALHQHAHDFFLNRGVPEFILFMLGKKIDTENWKKIEQSMQAHVGLGNTRKSMALNLSDPEMVVQLEKLGIDAGLDSDSFSSMCDALALEVVTSHGVPSLLAGIQIPGKLGATNELPNALRAFQLLLIGPAQQAFTSILDCTLGDNSINGNLGLTEGDFVLRAITDELDLDQLDTSSQMRETEEDAKKSGRDLKEGLKKELEKIDSEELRDLLERAWATAMERVSEKMLAA